VWWCSVIAIPLTATAQITGANLVLHGLEILLKEAARLSSANFFFDMVMVIMTKIDSMRIELFLDAQ
jgi:hypothetical protein